MKRDPKKLGQPRYRRPAKYVELPYKSMLEQILAKGKLSDWDYEPYKVDFISKKGYIPDFVSKNENIWIEAKGRFQIFAEAKKYLDIRDCHPEVELVFVFQDPKKKAYPQVPKRKDGTRLSMGEWATLNGFLWYTPETLPSNLEEIVNERRKAKEDRSVLQDNATQGSGTCGTGE